MGNPSTHQHPHPATSRPPGSGHDWAPWNRAWTKQAALLSGRTDLSVHVAPGAGGGAPACFYPQHRRIEVDATYIGAPDITNPNRAGHKRHVPTGYGLLVHEAAHAAHSHWRTPPDTPPVVAAVADQLEESRAEARHRTRRPRDRRWLRHAVTTLLDPGDAPVDDAWHAAGLAALLLARVDARTLTGKDVRAVRAAVTTVLGRRRLTQLRAIWRQAHQVDDTDHAGMIDLAGQWCRILGIDPTRQPHRPTADPGVFPGRLAAALGTYLAAAHGQTPAQYTATLHAARHSPPATWQLRDPTDPERHAAAVLAARLRQARTRHPEPGHRPETVPPGRLRTRAAITLDAQRAAGLIPTGAPWQRRAPQPPPQPEQRIGVLVDVSASMRAWTAPLSSAAWILARAAHGNHALTATIAFAGRASIVVAPRGPIGQVRDMVAAGGTTAFPDAIKVADRLLDLRHTRLLRLLAVVSDGDLPDPEAAQHLISLLHHTGCAVLWLRPVGMPGRAYTDTTTITVTDPVDAIGHIGDAAVAALHHT